MRDKQTKPVRQVGTTLVFRPGVTKEDADRAIKLLEHLLDGKPQTQTFDPAYGMPCFYIP